MQQDRDRKLLGEKVEGAMHHLRQSQKRWAAGDCPSLPLEKACLGSRGRPQCCDEAAGKDKDGGCWAVSMKSDMETTNAEDKLCGSRRGKRALSTLPGTNDENG